VAPQRAHAPQPGAARTRGRVCHARHGSHAPPAGARRAAPPVHAPQPPPLRPPALRAPAPAARQVQTLKSQQQQQQQQGGAKRFCGSGVGLGGAPAAAAAQAGAAGDSQLGGVYQLQRSMDGTE
jgi:hypothetical protein